MRGDFYMLIFIGFLVVFNLGLAAYIGAGGMPDMPEDAALFLAFFTLLPLVWLKAMVTISNKQNEQEEEPDFSISDLDWSEGTIDSDSKYNHQWD
ncbi:MAG: hypothetical protein CBD88_00375 [Flavobacteriales bacterium TMED228]|nr:MAG: hypothetical protein CBD88_01280 [Flavobacteriales bacterium TMED228]OUW99578.1 MAG: hypothetical protein CBD88_00375 [Flavobacteriales bacterium TMED228]|tara:strand:- start:1649 stop:1933 length:285 start_codon:yes stop_codon:yes gene_type:complete